MKYHPSLQVVHVITIHQYHTNASNDPRTAVAAIPPVQQSVFVRQPIAMAQPQRRRAQNPTLTRDD